MSGVAGEIEKNRHGVLTEDGGVGWGHVYGGGRFLEPVVEHKSGE